MRANGKLNTIGRSSTAAAAFRSSCESWYVSPDDETFQPAVLSTLDRQRGGVLAK